MNYIQICKNCGSDQVARLEWVTVNTGEPISGDPGIYTEWCFGCEEQIRIIDKKNGNCEKDDCYAMESNSATAWHRRMRGISRIMFFGKLMTVDLAIINQPLHPATMIAVWFSYVFSIETIQSLYLHNLSKCFRFASC